MHRTLERLDAAASTIVPLLYLAGLALGVVSYFTGLTAAGFAVTVGVGLASAAEIHSFLQQRRVRAAWGILARTAEDDPRRGQLVTHLRVNVALLVGLIAFSSYNAIAFAAATWRPSPGFLPPAVQIAVRGLVVPVLFLASGFLAPLHADAGALLASASHEMLHKTVRSTVRQWHQRVDRAKRQGLDLAPVAVALMEDSGHTDGARRIRLIAAGLESAERGIPPAAISAGPVFESDPEPPSPPPTGPGGPGAGRVITPGHPRRRGGHRADVLRLTPPTVEMRVRDVLAEHPSASVGQIAKWAHVGKSAASKWRQVITAEGPSEDGEAREA